MRRSPGSTAPTVGSWPAGKPVVLTLLPSDPPLADGSRGSGVAATDYAVNGGSVTTYTGPLTFTDGLYSVAYWSVDRAGNVEPV